jgi:DNA-binding CsgD family transcriptional regulator/pimeloyl-ACP methyl ester carboxylesterase
MEPPPVQYVTTRDGFDIAYTVCGEGRPYVYMPHIANHLQLSWNIAGRTEWLQGLAARHRLICYDSRGQGLSQRGLPADFSLDDFVRDLEAVVERLALDHFVLDAQSFFGHVAVKFAVAHADAVEGLVLKHCSLQSQANSSAQRDLARESWDHYLTLVSGLTSGDRDASVEFLSQTSTQQDWLTLVDGVGVSEIADFLPRLDVPTLLLHARGFTGLKEEEGSKLAARIAGAQLVLTEGTSIVIEASQGLQAIDTFLSENPPRVVPAMTGGPDSALLSAREIEVLRLLSAGKSNQDIADELVISLNTVRRHVSNIFDKTGVANRAEAATYAARNGIS